MATTAQVNGSSGYSHNHVLTEEIPLSEINPAASSPQPESPGRGWCPLQLSILRQKYPRHIDFFRSLGPCRAPRDHSRCLDEGRCKAYDSDDRKHRPKHVCTDERGCRSQGIPEEKLLPILRKGRLPVLCFTSNHPEQDIGTAEAGQTVPFLDVRELRASDTYVAISHVWSDGLGNSDENALPICQLKKIRRSVEAILSSRSLLPSRGRRFVSTMAEPAFKTES